MRTSVALYGAMLTLLGALGGCSGKVAPGPKMVSWYGSYPLNQEIELEVTAHGMSQMEYLLRHGPTDRVLLSDVGSDRDGWFFIWDDQDRLWAHWDDIGTFVWTPSSYLHYERHRLGPDSPLVSTMPSYVREKLPAWARKSLKISAANR